MKTEDFQTLSAEIAKLTPHQRKLLSKRLDKIQNVQAVNTLIESKVATATVCPKCAHDKIARWGSASGLQRYRCVACKATFNALTGTPLARLRKRSGWITPNKCSKALAYAKAPKLAMCIETPHFAGGIAF
jgi:Zn ribbon nucleic-acid-binding protein